MKDASALAELREKERRLEHEIANQMVLWVKLREEAAQGSDYAAGRAGTLLLEVTGAVNKLKVLRGRVLRLDVAKIPPPPKRPGEKEKEVAAQIVEAVVARETVRGISFSSPEVPAFSNRIAEMGSLLVMLRRGRKKKPPKVEAPAIDPGAWGD